MLIHLQFSQPGNLAIQTKTVFVFTPDCKDVFSAVKMGVFTISAGINLFVSGATRDHSGNFRFSLFYVIFIFQPREFYME